MQPVYTALTARLRQIWQAIPKAGLALCFGISAPLPATAQQDLITAEIRPGWRTDTGVHRAGLVLRMAPGWKTYWRAPGDAGIPPLMTWDGSHNLADVQIDWPTPSIDWTDGMRSVVYDGQVTLPLTVTPRQDHDDVHLSATVQLGVCADVCVPAMLTVSATLPADARARDPMIASALVDMPLTRSEARVRAVTCTIAPDPKGLRLTATLTMPPAGQTEDTIIETATPQVWASVPRTTRTGNTLVAQTRLIHVEGGAFALDRSGVRITVLGSDYAVDVQGCS